MSAIKGYSSDSKKTSVSDDSIQNYVTQQKAGAGKVGMDMLPKALYDVQLGVSLVPEVGSTVESIVLTAHGFKEGYVVRFDAGVNEGAEATVFNVIDLNTIELGHKFDTAILPADTFKQLRYLTLTIDSSGSLSTTAGPLQILKGDSGVFTAQIVTKDDTDANNTIPLPVEIVSFDGTEINITAGDINVQTSHTGANPDSMRIGDGVTEWGIELVTKKGLVKDALVEAAIVAVGVQLPATIGIKADAASLSVTQSTEDRAATVLRDSNIADTDTATTASAASLANIEAQLPATLGSKADAASLAVTQSTEDKLIQTGMSAKLPATLGRKAEAASMSVTFSTEDNTIQDAIKTAVEALASGAPVGVVDQGDTPLLLTGTIPKSSTVAPLVVVASTAAIATKVQTIEDIGEFLGLYDTAGPTLLCVLPVAGGEVDVTIPLGTSLGIKNMKDTDLVIATLQVGFAINLIG